MSHTFDRLMRSFCRTFNLHQNADIQIGGMTLSEVSYGWPDLEAITSPK
jgi:hypothetical protein